MTEEPDTAAGTVAAGPDHELSPAHPAHAAPGGLARVADLVRNRPVVLVAAVAAGFLLGRLLKHALRSRTEGTS